MNQLSFSYGRKAVLKHFDMRLSDGNIYGLLGENGVGKTTLLTLLAGVKKAQEGSLLIDGHVPFERDAEFLANQYYLMDEVPPVKTQALHYAETTGALWPRFSLDKFKEILSVLGVEANQRMDEMSAGQLKKTYIAFALSCNVKYLYLDEPTNGLDIPGKALFRQVITKYTSDDAIVIISTHQVRDLENIINPIIIMDNEGIILYASEEEITRRLYFSYGEAPDEAALYREDTPSGSIQVSLNPTGTESKLNLDALFNAVHLHKERIQALFRDNK